MSDISAPVIDSKLKSGTNIKADIGNEIRKNRLQLFTHLFFNNSFNSEIFLNYDSISLYELLPT